MGRPTWCWTGVNFLMHLKWYSAPKNKAFSTCRLEGFVQKFVICSLMKNCGWSDWIRAHVHLSICSVRWKQSLFLLQRRECLQNMRIWTTEKWIMPQEKFQWIFYCVQPWIKPPMLNSPNLQVVDNLKNLNIDGWFITLIDRVVYW